MDLLILTKGIIIDIVKPLVGKEIKLCIKTDAGFITIVTEGSMTSFAESLEVASKTLNEIIGRTE